MSHTAMLFHKRPPLLNFHTLTFGQAPSWLSRSRLRAYATLSPDNLDSEAPPRPFQNPFPYPSNPKPTPHQIFHISVGATQVEIKARYYELVKIHHPDSFQAGQLSPELAHARFRAIQAAYDFLRGRTLSPHPNARPTPPPQNFDPFMHEMARRRRAYYASRGAYSRGDEDGTESEKWARPGWGDGFGAPASERSVWDEDGWRERLILALGVMTLLAGLFPSMPFTIASLIAPTLFFTSPSEPPSSESIPESTSPPSSVISSTSISIPFIDMDKGHREAVSALVQVRTERQEMGAERREGVRKRVQEMSTTDLPEQTHPSSSLGGEDAAVPADPETRSSTLNSNSVPVDRPPS